MGLQGSPEVSATWLRQRHPEWDIWYVPLYPTGTAWCAKPKDEPVATHRAYSPEGLDADLTSA